MIKKKHVSRRIRCMPKSFLPAVLSVINLMEEEKNKVK
jgi:hypothetical protein